MKELKFIHITKCAGTSIEDAGKKRGYLWGQYHSEYGSHWHTIFPLVKSDIIHKYDWFMVVRNPYTRMISEYYCRWGGIGGHHIIHTAKQMNEFLIQKIKCRSMDGRHYTEQYKYLHPTATIHILKFENVTAEFNALMATYDIKGVVLGHQNSRESNTNAALQKFSPADFSKELITLINDVYDKDFSSFGYEKIVI
jgi:hypothetical protein